MKRIVLFALTLISVLSGFAQQPESTDADSIAHYLNEIKVATQKGVKLWNKDLYGAILLVDPKTRQVYSNETDLNNTLKPLSSFYAGILPDSVNIANTAVKWSGKTWAMIMLPLPKEYHNRINLLAHELFHTAQTSLGFIQFNKESNHLDQKEGRIYLRLELEALRNAILSDSKTEQQKHLTNAIAFRKYRNSLFPESADIENQLELNEGLAEYTGFMISDRNKEQRKQYFVNNLNTLLKNPTYVRSFAYSTTPMYGYLLSLKKKDWNLHISGDSNLTEFFIKSLNVKLPGDLKSTAEKITKEYKGESIIQEEAIREAKIKQRIADYKAKFIEQPHFEIKFERMNVSFDPGNIVPVEDKGTVYPNMRVTDNWGILEVSNGALMHPNWDRLSVSIPTKLTEQQVEGDGWVLQLNEKYSVVKDEKTNNYIIVKK